LTSLLDRKLVQKEEIYGLLVRKTGSETRAEELLSDLAMRLTAGHWLEKNRALCAMALCQLGYTPDQVARLLTWGEFEQFCANILRVSGFQVRHSIFLRKPRRQLDVLATSASFCLSIDCKHWDRSLSVGALSRIAKAQLSRSQMLRRHLSLETPIATVILTLFPQDTRFAEGVAVVPLLSLSSFLESFEGLKGNLTLV
jgi:hypothetical protein